MPSIRLPRADGGGLAPYTMREPVAWPVPNGPFRSRVAYAAAHVVCDPLADADPLLDAPVDWEATLAFRRHLWSLGFAVAEAMDTAQRGMGLGWPVAQELIRRSIAEARACGGTVASGAGTDHLAPADGVTLDDVALAYEEQVGFVEGEGGRVILMASRALARAARSPDDYVRVYGRILSQVRQPVILHWLGDMFDPQLAGYWGTRDVGDAMATCLDVIRAHADKVDGIKISLLDDAREVDMRRRLPAGVRMYTGDDFNYDRLIAGDAEGYSDALLGIFDPIAPAASAALRALDAGDMADYDRLLAPTVPLSRHVFRRPTYAYKTGVVFLAYLNGHQSHFRMLGGAESWRSVPHLAELFRLADAAGLLADPDLACRRMRLVLDLAGGPDVSGLPMPRGTPNGSPNETPDGTRSFDDVARLSFNQITADGSSLREVVEGCARHGIPYVSVWRHKLADAGVDAAARLLRDAGVRVSSVCRGGMFPASTHAEREARIDDNCRALDDAAALGAEVLVLVCGAAPDRDIAAAREMVADGVARLVPYARERGVRLGIEPLHPAFAAERSCITTLREATRLAASLDPDVVGVVADVYHIWWDPELYDEIARAGARILGFHVSDWLVPATNVLMSRGMMGDGVIELRRIRAAVDRIGYAGPIEVEIFNQQFWSMAVDELLPLTKQRYLAHV